VPEFWGFEDRKVYKCGGVIYGRKILFLGAILSSKK